MFLQSFVVPIIKVTDSCNFTCEYCHYAQKHLSSRLMTKEECFEIIQRCFEYNIRNHNKKMRVIFHGGEPLLQPISFYEDMVIFENQLVQTVPDFVFYNSIQTNGYLINEQWVEFFKRSNFDIGISIDGDARYNKHFGKDGVITCTQKVLDNIHLLNSNNIPYGVISVITNQHTASADDLYNFCVENEIHDLSLNYCYNAESDDTVSNELLAPFVTRLFDLYYNGSFELNVREFNEAIARKLGYCTDTCATCDRNNCGQYLAFDVDGNIYFCDTEYKKSTALGNIRKESLYQILDSFKYLEMVYKCRNVYHDFCKKCKWVSMCGGGCHRYDTKCGQEFGHNYFCTTHKALCMHISETLDSNSVNDQ